MKRTIDQTNPFYNAPRFAFGYEHIREGVRLLDYGCFDAQFGSGLVAKKPVDYYGVDKNADVVKRVHGLRVLPIKKELPFEDNYFDVATIFEVLEHIHDQKAVLREIRRVLKPGGLLLLSVPQKHIFSALDSGNFKFVFPKAHRLYYTLRYSEDAYLSRYLNNPNGLVGDVEKEKSWHQHFRPEELTALLNQSGFALQELDGAGFFGSAFDFVVLLAPPLRHLFTQRLRNWDSYRFSSRSLLCAARKAPEHGN